MLYNYNGTSRVVETDYPYNSGSGSGPAVESRAFNLHGTGGDNNYNGFDRFGRTKELEWWRYTATTGYRDSFKYGYDSAGNRTWREDVEAAANSKDYDYYYTYDGLHRLSEATRGNLNGTYSGVTSANFLQLWSYLEPLGNWQRFLEDNGGDGWDVDQERTHNAANEITGRIIRGREQYCSARHLRIGDQASARI